MTNEEERERVRESYGTAGGDFTEHKLPQNKILHKTAKTKALSKKKTTGANSNDRDIANLELLRAKMHKAWGPKNKEKVDMHFPHLNKTSK